jgi:hypothetical protein
MASSRRPEAVIRSGIGRLAIGLGVLILAGAAAPRAHAFGHHGGHHGGVFFGVGFGLPGCCAFGGPYGYYPPYYPTYYPAPPPVYANPAPPVYYSPAPATAPPAPASPAASGDACREYQTTVTIDGRPQQAFGVTCRQADGSWRIAR